MVPRTIWDNLEAEALFDRIKYRDQLVHHPFDSFSAVEAFLDAAVDDPHVVAIKITLYRIGGNSPIVERLIEAAERGKQVAVLVELKARFDERSNITWATRMEEAGIHVVYGLAEPEDPLQAVSGRPQGRRSHPAVRPRRHRQLQSRHGADLHRSGSLHGQRGDRRRRLRALQPPDRLFASDRVPRAPRRADGVARCSLRRSSSEKWHTRVPGGPAASSSRTIRCPIPTSCACCIGPPAAGVRVDAIVRGICCLRPGIPGVSDLIHVRSIVGRFLEHSRIYCFENGGEPEIYIGSADLMERNLDRRVEALCPVLDPEIRRYLRDELLQAYLRDDTRASVLRADGRYEPIDDAEAGTLDAQHVLISRRAPGSVEVRS